METVNDESLSSRHGNVRHRVVDRLHPVVPPLRQKHHFSVYYSRCRGWLGWDVYLHVDWGGVITCMLVGVGRLPACLLGCGDYLHVGWGGVITCMFGGVGWLPVCWLGWVITCMFAGLITYMSGVGWLLAWWLGEVITCALTGVGWLPACCLGWGEPSVGHSSGWPSTSCPSQGPTTWTSLGMFRPVLLLPPVGWCHWTWWGFCHYSQTWRHTSMYLHWVIEKHNKQRWQMSRHLGFNSLSRHKLLGCKSLPESMAMHPILGDKPK